MSSKSISRRSAFAVGAGSMLLAGLASGAQAAEMTAGEKTNVKAVNDFLKLWANEKVTAAESVAFFTDDCVVRTDETKPAAVGKAAATAVFEAFISRGIRFKITTHETFAKGPMVANHRNDLVVVNGKPGPDIAVVGMFIVRNGKIQEWTDYLMPKAT
jgi:limonene-1,2-epoxide hydrolase